MTRFLWLCVLGLVAAAAADESAAAPTLDEATLDPELLDAAVAHVAGDDDLIRKLKDGDVDALHSVADSIDDRLTGAKIWHFLADGPSRHVEAAYGLGKTYGGAPNKDASRMALKYFLQAAGEDEDGSSATPHQAGMYGAGQVFANLARFSSAMDYFRRCIAVGEDRPDLASEEVTASCGAAYEMLYEKILGMDQVPGGVTGAAEMFLHASPDGFPSPDSEEYATWTRAKGNLDAYSTLLRDNMKSGNYVDHSDEAALVVAAREGLMKLEGTSGMSTLQEHLLKAILLRVNALVKNHEGRHDEL